MNTAQYLIPESNIATLEETIARLAKRAKKLGLAPITMTRGEARDFPYVSYSGSVKAFDAATSTSSLADLERDGLIVYRRSVEVTITGESPTLNGWQFCAVLQHVDSDAGPLCVLRTVPGFDAQLPARFRTATPETCDHCQTKRRRNETFVVRKIDPLRIAADVWLQVGRNCLADFLGNVDAHKLAAQLEMLLAACGAAAGCSDEEGFGGGRGVARWSLRYVLAVTAMLVRREGWMSRGKARDLGNVPATADSVTSYVNPPPAGSVAYDRWSKWVNSCPVEAQDKAMADAAYDFARSDLAEKGDNRDDYEHNLYVATVQDSIDARMFGIACSLISYYQREIARRVEANSGASSQHLGAVKDQLLLNVKLAQIIPIDGSYGTSYLHKFIDEKGNHLSWFASNRGEMAPGESYLVWATVKGHESFRGVKQTMVTRVVTTTPEAAAVEVAKRAKKAERAAKKAAAAAV